MACQDLGNCDDDRIAKIYEYLDGELSAGDLEAIKEHLNTCPECAEHFDVETVIRQAVKRCCTEAAPEDLKDKIVLKLHATGASSSH